MSTVTRRTFEAEKYPKGSQERDLLNMSAITSEYQHSHKYAAEGGCYLLTFRTKREALAFANKSASV